MDGSKVAGGVKSGISLLQDIVVGVGVFFILAVVTVLIAGSITKIGTGGSIPVSTGTNTTLTALDTSLNTSVTSVVSNMTVAIGLVAVAIVLVVFGFFLKGKMGGSADKSY